MEPGRRMRTVSGWLACLALLMMVVGVRQAGADCVDSGLATMNQCSSFISTIKAQTDSLNTLPCSTIKSNINSGQYGVPSSGCCSSANQFFGSNCQNDNFIYAQATGPFGFTDASLRAAATVTALKCGSGGSLSRC